MTNLVDVMPAALVVITDTVAGDERQGLGGVDTAERGATNRRQ